MNNENFSFSVKINESAIKTKITTAIAKAQKKLDAKVLADSNYFVPLKTSTLQKSGINNTVLGSGLVVWKTPYASAQYYGEHFDHSTQNNPNACSKWFEVAKARKSKEWEKIVNDEIKNI